MSGTPDPTDDLEGLEFGVLGPLEVRRNGRTVRLGTPKERTVLAVLLIHAGQVVGTDRLAAELWGDDLPGDARASIQTYVSRLRRAMRSDDLRTHAPGYVLDIAPEQCDAYRFEGLASAGRAAAREGRSAEGSAMLRDALALWRGRAFADIECPAAEAEAVRLEEVRLVATEDRIGADLSSGMGAELVAELEMITAEHPLRERLWGHRMLALYRAGRQAEALAAYADVREVLAESLGVDPGPELRELEHSILRQDGALMAAPARPSVVAAPLTSFVGRARELEEARRLVGERRLVTLTGLGGIGKSRLAVELARTRDDALGVVLLSSLAEPRLVAATVAEGIGVPEQPRRPSIDNLADALRHRAALIVLDGCDQVARAAGETAVELLSRCPSLRVVATSPEPLGVPDEAVLPVGPLDAGDARRLFAERAQAAGMRAAAPAPVVDAILERTGCIPLAIELAAAHARVLTPEQIVGLLDAPESDPSWGAVRAAIETSCAQLGPRDEVAFRRVGVFSGAFDIAAATDVCPGGDLAADDMLSAIERLADLALIVVEPGAGRMRYRLPGPVRRLARDRLRPAGEEAEIRRAHLAHVSSVSKDASAAVVTEVLEDVRGALAWAIRDGGDPDGGLALATSLELFWREAGHVEEGRVWLREAEAAARPRELVEATTRLLLGRLALAAGDLEEAERESRLAAEGAERYGDVRLAARVRELGALIDHVRGAPDGGQGALEAVVATAQLLGDDRWLGSVLNNLAVVVSRRGDRDRARALLESGVAAARRAGDARQVGRSLMNLGDIARDQGDYAGAESAFTRALRTAEASGAKRNEGEIHSALAVLAWTRGEPGIGERHARMALEIARQISYRLLEFNALAALATFVRSRGDSNEAAALIEESLEIADASGDPRQIAFGTLALADHRCEQGDLRAASRLAVRSLEIRVGLGDPVRVAECLEVAASILVARGDHGPASELLSAAERLTREAGYELPGPVAERHEKAMAMCDLELGPQLDEHVERGAALGLEASVARACALLEQS